MLARQREQGTRAHQDSLSRSLKATWLRISAGEGFMYVAEIVGTGNVKVGFSLNPERRMMDWAGRVRLLGKFPASRAAEHQFHRLHAAKAVEREVYPRSVFGSAA